MGGDLKVRKDDGTIGWWSCNEEGRRHPVSGGRKYIEAMASWVMVALLGRQLDSVAVVVVRVAYINKGYLYMLIIVHVQ